MSLCRDDAACCGGQPVPGEGMDDDLVFCRVCGNSVRKDLAGHSLLGFGRIPCEAADTLSPADDPLSGQDR